MIPGISGFFGGLGVSQFGHTGGVSVCVSCFGQLGSFFDFFPSSWYLFTQSGIPPHGTSFPTGGSIGADGGTTTGGTIGLNSISHFPVTVAIGLRSISPVLLVSTRHTSRNAKLRVLNAFCILDGICMIPFASIGRRKLGPPAFGVITARILPLVKSVAVTL